MKLSPKEFVRFEMRDGNLGVWHVAGAKGTLTACGENILGHKFVIVKTAMPEFGVVCSSTDCYRFFMKRVKQA